MFNYFIKNFLQPSPSDPGVSLFPGGYVIACAAPAGYISILSTSQCHQLCVGAILWGDAPQQLGEKNGG